MKILRYLDDRQIIRHGCEQPDGAVLELEGSLENGFGQTSNPAKIHKLLAPVLPVQILAIRLQKMSHVGHFL